MLKSAGFEMVQMVWYPSLGSGVAVQEQGGKGHSRQNIVEGSNEQYRCWGRLIELGCGS
jgi:hypothetical protein